jgi:hypothetical protein
MSATENFDLNAFLDGMESKVVKQPKSGNKEKKKFNREVELSSRKEFMGKTCVLKPILDLDRKPFRVIENYKELHFKYIKDDGSEGWVSFAMMGDITSYNNIEGNPKLMKLHSEILAKAQQMAEYKLNKLGFLIERKQYTLFYGLGLNLENLKGEQQFKEPAFVLFKHTSAKLMQAYYQARADKTASKKGNSAWIGDYYKPESNNHIMSIGTKPADIGMTVTVSFTYDEDGTYALPSYDSYKEDIKKLDDEVVSVEFNETRAEWVLKQLNNWLERQANLTEKENAPASASPAPKDIEDAKISEATSQEVPSTVEDKNIAPIAEDGEMPAPEPPPMA